MRISDWSSDVCSSDLKAKFADPFGLPSSFSPISLSTAQEQKRQSSLSRPRLNRSVRRWSRAMPEIRQFAEGMEGRRRRHRPFQSGGSLAPVVLADPPPGSQGVDEHADEEQRSEEHTSEPQSL